MRCQPTCRFKCGWMRRALPEQGMGRPLTGWTSVNDNTVSSLVTEAGSKVSALRAWAASHDDRLQTRTTVRTATADRGDSSALHYPLRTTAEARLYTDRMAQDHAWSEDTHGGRRRRSPDLRHLRPQSVRYFIDISPGPPVGTPHYVHAPLGRIKGRACTLERDSSPLTLSQP